MRVRPGIVFPLCLLAAGAFAAEDARVAFLSRQLATAKDPRVRAQTALLLGQTANEAAVQPLCGVLKDPEAIVRTAAANALGELASPAAIECLKTALGESDPAVRTAMERALKAQGGGKSATPGASQPTPGGLYVQLEPVQDKVGGLSEEAVALAERLLRERLTALGASFAPSNEDKKAAANLIRAKKLQGYLLRLQLLPGASEKALKIEMLVMTYPEQSLKGTWNVKAAGAKPESLIKAMVPRVVDDAANDLDWKN